MTRNNKAFVVLILAAIAPLAAAMPVVDHVNAMVGELANTFNGWIFRAIYFAFPVVSITAVVFFVLGLEDFIVFVMRVILSKLGAELPIWMSLARIYASGRAAWRMLRSPRIWWRARIVAYKINAVIRPRIERSVVWRRLEDRMKSRLNKRPWSVLERRIDKILEPKGLGEGSLNVDRQFVGGKAPVVDAVRGSPSTATSIRPVVDPHAHEQLAQKRRPSAESEFRRLLEILSQPTLMQAIEKALGVDEMIERKLKEYEGDRFEYGMLYLTAVWILGVWPTRRSLLPGFVGPAELAHARERLEVGAGAPHVFERVMEYRTIYNNVEPRLRWELERTKGELNDAAQRLDKAWALLRDAQLREARSIEAVYAAHRNYKKAAADFRTAMMKARGLLEMAEMNLEARVERRFGVSFERALRMAKEDPQFALRLASFIGSMEIKRDEAGGRILAKMGVIGEVAADVKKAYLYRHIAEIVKARMNDPSFGLGRDVLMDEVRRLEAVYGKGLFPVVIDEAVKRAILRDPPERLIAKLNDTADRLLARARERREDVLRAVLKPWELKEAELLARPRSIVDYSRRYTPTIALVQNLPKSTKLFRDLKTEVRLSGHAKEAFELALFNVAAKEGAESGWLSVVRLPSDRFHGAILKSGLSPEEALRYAFHGKGNPALLKTLEPVKAEEDAFFQLGYAAASLLFRYSKEEMPNFAERWRKMREYRRWLEENRMRVEVHLRGQYKDEEVAGKLEEMLRNGIILKSHDDLDFAINRLREWDKVEPIDPRALEYVELRMKIRQLRIAGHSTTVYEKRLREIEREFLAGAKTEEERNRISSLLTVESVMRALRELGKLDPKLDEYYVAINRILHLIDDAYAHIKQRNEYRDRAEELWKALHEMDVKRLEPLIMSRHAYLAPLAEELKAQGVAHPWAEAAWRYAAVPAPITALDLPLPVLEKKIEEIKDALKNKVEDKGGKYIPVHILIKRIAEARGWRKAEEWPAVLDQEARNWLAERGHWLIAAIMGPDPVLLGRRDIGARSPERPEAPLLYLSEMELKVGRTAYAVAKEKSPSLEEVLREAPPGALAYIGLLLPKEYEEKFAGLIVEAKLADAFAEAIKATNFDVEYAKSLAESAGKWGIVPNDSSLKLLKNVEQLKKELYVRLKRIEPRKIGLMLLANDRRAVEVADAVRRVPNRLDAMAFEVEPLKRAVEALERMSPFIESDNGAAVATALVDAFAGPNAAPLLEMMKAYAITKIAQLEAIGELELAEKYKRGLTLLIPREEKRHRIFGDPKPVPEFKTTYTSFEEAAKAAVDYVLQSKAVEKINIGGRTAYIVEFPMAPLAEFLHLPYVELRTGLSILGVAGEELARASPEELRRSAALWSHLEKEAVLVKKADEIGLRRVEYARKREDEIGEHAIFMMIKYGGLKAAVIEAMKASDLPYETIIERAEEYLASKDTSADVLFLAATRPFELGRYVANGEADWNKVVNALQILSAYVEKSREAPPHISFVYSRPRDPERIVDYIREEVVLGIKYELDLARPRGATIDPRLEAIALEAPIERGEMARAPMTLDGIKAFLEAALAPDVDEATKIVPKYLGKTPVDYKGSYVVYEASKYAKYAMDQILEKMQGNEHPIALAAYVNSAYAFGELRRIVERLVDDPGFVKDVPSNWRRTRKYLRAKGEAPVDKAILAIYAEKDLYDELMAVAVDIERLLILSAKVDPYIEIVRDIIAERTGHKVEFRTPESVAAFIMGDDRYKDLAIALGGIGATFPIAAAQGAPTIYWEVYKKHIMKAVQNVDISPLAGLDEAKRAIAAALIEYIKAKLAEENVLFDVERKAEYAKAAEAAANKLKASLSLEPRFVEQPLSDDPREFLRNLSIVTVWPNLIRNGDRLLLHAVMAGTAMRPELLVDLLEERRGGREIAAKALVAISSAVERPLSPFTIRYGEVDEPLKRILPTLPLAEALSKSKREAAKVLKSKAAGIADAIFEAYKNGIMTERYFERLSEALGVVIDPKDRRSVEEALSKFGERLEEVEIEPTLIQMPDVRILLAAKRVELAAMSNNLEQMKAEIAEIESYGVIAALYVLDRIGELAKHEWTMLPHAKEVAQEVEKMRTMLMEKFVGTRETQF